MKFPIVVGIFVINLYKLSLEPLAFLPLFYKKQKEKCAHRRNVILGIIKAHYTMVKTRPSTLGENCALAASQ